jgi:hypothetical protein
MLIECRLQQASMLSDRILVALAEAMPEPIAGREATRAGPARVAPI